MWNGVLGALVALDNNAFLGLGQVTSKPSTQIQETNSYQVSQVVGDVAGIYIGIQETMMAGRVAAASVGGIVFNGGTAAVPASLTFASAFALGADGVNTSINGTMDLVDNVVNLFSSQGPGNGVPKDFEKQATTASDISAKAGEGKIKYSSNYHGRLGKEKEIDIISNPDSIYVAGNN